MLCKCRMFLYRNGELVCSVCGKPAKSPQIEDKIATMPEVKGKKKFKNEVK
jgi:uncharacterized Zn finger protein (UPF0148 family)